MIDTQAFNFSNINCLGFINAPKLLRKIIRKSTLTALAIALLALTACAPEVRSDALRCTEMKEKPKTDWAAYQTAHFAKSCVFK